MRVAAIADIHGNLDALDAVLRDIRRVGVDQIVVPGDVIPGPLPHETLSRLLELEIPTRFLYGNGERAVLAQMTARDPSEVTYWGTSSGAPLPEAMQEVFRWTGRQVADYQQVLESWPSTITFEIDGLGAVLFCHATPRNETEIFTRVTPEARLLPVFADVDASVVVCGHTHMQFDRMVGRTRVVNAGSVGMPFDKTGAFWLLMGPDIEMRHTEYDLEKAAARFRTTGYPLVEDFAVRYVLNPPSEAQILAAYADAELPRVK